MPFHMKAARQLFGKGGRHFRFSEAQTLPLFNYDAVEII